MVCIGASTVERDRSAGGRRVARGIDRRQQGRDRRLLGIVDDPGRAGSEVDGDGGDPRDGPQRLIHVLHASVAGHPGDGQGSDHARTVAW
jgi:hypothetical protein